jgi:hypothetical protein
MLHQEDGHGPRRQRAYFCNPQCRHPWGCNIDSIIKYTYRCKDRGQALPLRFLMVTREGVMASREEQMPTLQHNNNIGCGEETSPAALGVSTLKTRPGTQICTTVVLTMWDKLKDSWLHPPATIWRQCRAFDTPQQHRLSGCTLQIGHQRTGCPLPSTRDPLSHSHAFALGAQ